MIVVTGYRDGKRITKDLGPGVGQVQGHGGEALGFVLAHVGSQPPRAASNPSLDGPGQRAEAEPMRKCRCCRVRWPLSCFKPNNRCRGGRLPTCRACQGGACKRAPQRYYEAHRAEVIARVSAYKAQLRADVMAVRAARAA